MTLAVYSASLEPFLGASPMTNHIGVLLTGLCSTGPSTCLFDPSWGIANFTEYNRFQFLDFAILFYSDAAIAVNLAGVCQAATTGSTEADFNSTAQRATVRPPRPLTFLIISGCRLSGDWYWSIRTS